MAKKIYIKSAAAGGRSRVRSRPPLKAEYHVGETLPMGYVVDEIIARGGSGMVLKAHKPAIDPPIYKAIKVINVAGLNDETCRIDIQREFYGEARISCMIGSDPYAIGVEDIIDLADGTRALIFPFVEGETIHDLLRQHLDRGLLLPFDLTAFIFHRILSVLDHARERDVPHRDLCPNNVMLQRTGVPMLLDWGAATEVNEGVLIGKPAYIAPEMLQYETDIPREAYYAADIFSLGVIIREMITGVNVLDYKSSPTTGYNPDAAFGYRESMDVSTLRPVYEICRDIPETLSDIVTACLAENPEDRPDAETLYDYLGAKYLYTAQIGFGATAETVKHYLEYFHYPPADTAVLPDNKLGRNMAKLVWSHCRRLAEQPEYREYTLKEIVAASDLTYTFGNIWRTFEDVYGEDAVRQARRRALRGLIERKYPEQPQDPNSLLGREIQQELDEVEQAPDEMLPDLLTRFVEAETCKSGAELTAAVNRVVFAGLQHGAKHWNEVA